MLGQCYRFNGQLPEAIALLVKSEQLLDDPAVDDGFRGSIYLALGIANQAAKEFDKAVVALQTGIDKTPQKFALPNSLGLTYKIINNFRESLLSYIRAQEIIVNEAIQSESIKLEDGSKTLYTDPHQTYLALKSSPDYCTVLNNIGGVYLKACDLESAEKAFKNSIGFIPEGFNYPSPHEARAFIKAKNIPRTYLLL